jgi:hypothetical protein
MSKTVGVLVVTGSRKARRVSGNEVRETISRHTVFKVQGVTRDMAQDIWTAVEPILEPWHFQNDIQLTAQFAPYAESLY